VLSAKETAPRLVSEERITMAINPEQEPIRNRFAALLRTMNRPVTSGVRHVVVLVILTEAIVLTVCFAARSDDRPPSITSQASVQTPGTGNIVGAASKGLVKANGITIAYESYGPTDHEAILLIMGMGAQLTAWPVELCDELVKRGYRVIIFDNRDVGLSTKFDSAGLPDMEAIFQAKTAGKPVPIAYTLDDMAKDAVGLLDALDIKKAHIVGVSMGGMIAQLVAADYPEHTLSLTSIMSTSGNPAVSLPAKPDVMAKLPPPAPRGNGDEIVARTIKMLQVLAGPVYPPDEKRVRAMFSRSIARSDDRNGIARHNAAVALGYYDDRRPKLKTVKVPAVVVHGELDPLIPVLGAQDTAANIPGAELRIIPGMGHDLPIPLVNTIADAITTAASHARSGKPKS
jgi:pimeloyl-ACP methyl ester carboxylesterase